MILKRELFVPERLLFFLGSPFWVTVVRVPRFLLQRETLTPEEWQNYWRRWV